MDGDRFEIKVNKSDKSSYNKHQGKLHQLRDKKFDIQPYQENPEIPNPEVNHSGSALDSPGVIHDGFLFLSSFQHLPSQFFKG
jgi:hypothetical protein